MVKRRPADRLFQIPTPVEDFEFDGSAGLNGHAVATPVRPQIVARPITSFTYPTADDPNVLLGSDDYLGRGGGMLFVSHAGAGKSSWIMDACMSWAIGRQWMGIKSRGALKSLIVQAEDSDRYIGKLFTSFAHMNEMSEDETTQLGENCIVVRLKGVSGAAFFLELKKLVAEHKPDLVVVNPIYLYAEGDIGRSEYAQPFLVGLDEVNKEEKFAYILVHHTGKPQAKGTNGKRAELEDWESAYMGFGSSYLANWPRCSALLEPLPGGENGRYRIRLGKGGLNAGVTKEVPHGVGTRTEAVTRIPIRHSQRKMPVNGVDRPVYYWEKDVEDAPGDAPPRNSNGGRKRSANFADYHAIFPPFTERPKTFAELTRVSHQNGPISKSTLFDAIKAWCEDGVIEKVEMNGRGVGYRKVKSGEVD